MRFLLEFVCSEYPGALSLTNAYSSRSGRFLNASITIATSVFANSAIAPDSNTLFQDRTSTYSARKERIVAERNTS